MPYRRFTRRDFLAGAASLGAALALPPGRPMPWAPARPVRVRGRVTALGRGVRDAGISDGLTVVASDREGRFELVTDHRREFLSLTPPPGFEFPVSAAGTAALHQPLRPNAAGEAALQFTLLPLSGSDERHACVVLADPQTEDAADLDRFHRETVPDVQGTVAGLGDLPVFGVADGDIMYDHLELYPEYERAVAAMGVPFFQVVGNHDLDLSATTNEAATATFRKHFGPTHYSFNRGRIHYVVLNNVFFYDGGYLGYLEGDQLGWLVSDLSRVEPGSTVVVFEHIPLRSSLFQRHGRAAPELGNTVSNRDALLEILEPFRSHIVSGHTHECEHRSYGKVTEHTLGAACGAWWTGDICYDGSPNGYGVFEARGDELRWRYKATGLAAESMARAYPAGSDPAAPDELIANVWDWDPSWTVAWIENGERRGRMARRDGTDPVAVRTMAGAELPRRRSWVDPVRTSHLFYAPVGPGARELKVEVTDGFGRSSVTEPLPIAAGR